MGGIVAYFGALNIGNTKIFMIEYAFRFLDVIF